MLSQVTHHSAIFRPFHAEHCPEIKLRLATRRRKWAHWSLLRALIRGPCGDKIPLGNQKLDRLDRIGRNCRILPQKFLDLLKTSSLNTRRCFAMADNVQRDEVVERIRPTTVPGVEETPDRRTSGRWRRRGRGAAARRNLRPSFPQQDRHSRYFGRPSSGLGLVSPRC